MISHSLYGITVSRSLDTFNINLDERHEGMEKGYVLTIDEAKHLHEVLGAALKSAEPQAPLAPADGICAQCEGRDFQLVEQTQQWHSGSFVLGEGWVFHGNAEWDHVGEDGEILHMECSSCLTEYQIPTYDWGV